MTKPIASLFAAGAFTAGFFCAGAAWAGIPLPAAALQRHASTPQARPVMCNAESALVEIAGKVPSPVTQKSPARTGTWRFQRISRRAAKLSGAPKRRRAIGESIVAETQATAEGGGKGADSAKVPTIMRQLRLVARTVRNGEGRARTPAGVSAANFRALALIDGRPGLQVGAFAQELGIHQSTASNLLEQLSRQGLVEKRRNGDDHRAVSVYATARGKAMLRKAPEGEGGTLLEALNRLSPASLDALQSRLEELMRALSPGAPTRA